MWESRRLLARFPRARGKRGKPVFGFPRFPQAGISTALFLPPEGRRWPILAKCLEKGSTINRRVGRLWGFLARYFMLQSPERRYQAFPSFFLLLFLSR
jgi:hypothetical protein